MFSFWSNVLSAPKRGVAPFNLCSCRRGSNFAWHLRKLSNFWFKYWWVPRKVSCAKSLWRPIIRLKILTKCLWLFQVEVSLAEKSNHIARLSEQLESKALQIQSLESALNQTNSDRALERKNFLEQINLSKKVCLGLLQNIENLEKMYLMTF